MAAHAPLCEWCDTPVAPGSSRCASCGAAVGEACPDCGESVDPDDGFCWRCGGLPEGEAPASVRRGPGAPAGPAPIEPRARRRGLGFVLAGLAAIAVSVLLAVLVLTVVPMATSSMSYTLPTPCALGAATAAAGSCPVAVQFNATWNSQVTVAWDSVPQSVPPPVNCVNVNGPFFTTAANQGSVTFTAPGGPVQCLFGPDPPENVWVKVTIVHPIL